jgi:hypothetical protein
MEKCLIKGILFNNRFGLYSVSIQSSVGKDLIPYVTPEFIDFDRESKKFIINVDLENPLSLT